MSVVVLVEVEEGRASLVSRETLAFARSLGAGDLHALVVGSATEAVLADSVSLPINPAMTDDVVDQTAEAVAKVARHFAA